ncbi:MAG: TlyA family RNA methyltransferase [Desulfobacterales bacterium]|nr:TlyA family RNA methyltransferase [Desulfobacterales bacterium]
MSEKKRLDILVVEKGLAQSRRRAQALIMAGKVFINNEPVTKPGTSFLTDAEIDLKQDDIPYVSRGGLKLEGALNNLDINISGCVCMDVGASTGGFTDCLLQNGASKVYAVDVGYGQLAWKLRQDERVVTIERTNIRHMPPEKIHEPIDLITIDVSFISLKIVVPVILQYLKTDSRILALIKPQFEVGKGKVGKGGVVKDPSLHEAVIEDLKLFFSGLQLVAEKIIPSPILGPKGNREFIISLLYNADTASVCSGKI